MTITASTDGQYAIYGSVLLDLSDMTPLATKEFFPRTLINADLDTTPYPTESNAWAIDWYLNLVTTGVIGNPSRFADALPKFNLGYATFTWRGQQSVSEFWNFASQRFPSMSMWTPTVNVSYPSPYVPPTPISEADLIGLGEESQPIDGHYGDGLYLNIVNADISMTTAWIYYQAGLVSTLSVPTSLGDL